jgi:hypothetical protein
VEPLKALLILIAVIVPLTVVTLFIGREIPESDFKVMLGMISGLIGAALVQWLINRYTK